MIFVQTPIEIGERWFSFRFFDPRLAPVMTVLFGIDKKTAACNLKLSDQMVFQCFGDRFGLRVDLEFLLFALEIE